MHSNNLLTLIFSCFTLHLRVEFRHRQLSSPGLFADLAAEAEVSSLQFRDNEPYFMFYWNCESLGFGNPRSML
jgi:hypothetical protein